MVRKFFNLAAVALSMVPLVSLHTPVKALTAAPVYYANSFISGSSWAGTGNMPTLIVSVRGQSVAGNMSGIFSATCDTWAANGYLYSEADYTDATGRYIEVKAYVYFKTAQAPNVSVPALATFHAVNKPDGSTAEGVEVTDLNGAVLRSTGYDANGNLILLPIMRGSLLLGH